MGGSDDRKDRLGKVDIPFVDTISAPCCWFAHEHKEQRFYRVFSSGVTDPRQEGFNRAVKRKGQRTEEPRMSQS